ncbi:hypothetical protein NMY22_g5945 [Coprinellus aureogranulatus]|nr:hypothetical protein NMY22_g5945 [Coprinellus aureogranulatus]
MDSSVPTQKGGQGRVKGCSREREERVGESTSTSIHARATGAHGSEPSSLSTPRHLNTTIPTLSPPFDSITRPYQYPTVSTTVDDRIARTHQRRRKPELRLREASSSTPVGRTCVEMDASRYDTHRDELNGLRKTSPRSKARRAKAGRGEGVQGWEEEGSEGDCEGAGRG